MLLRLFKCRDFYGGYVVMFFFTYMALCSKTGVDTQIQKGTKTVLKAVLLKMVAYTEGFCLILRRFI